MEANRFESALAQIAEHIRAAAAAQRPLCIQGGGSKLFFGNAAVGDVLDVRDLRADPRHEPAELVVTVAAGTPLAEIEALLAEAGQMLAFEPPRFGPAATVGGCVAAGLCGPRRIASGYAGGVLRDHVLGAKLLDGRGNLLSFGGTVIKNVAGYDVARLLAGSLGILGVIVEVSLKVVPRPADEATVMLECGMDEALRRCGDLGIEPWPVSASAWIDGRLYLRLSGASAAVAAARRAIGGETVTLRAADDLWLRLREQRLDFFELAADETLWRLSLPAGAPAGPGAGAASVGQGPLLFECHGMQRWLKTRHGGDAAVAGRFAADMRQAARRLGGHATRFRGDHVSGPAFEPLAPALLAIHQRLKREFDPACVFNRGRLQPQIDDVSTPAGNPP